MKVDKINKEIKERRRTARWFDGRERINGLPRETKWISNSQTPVKNHSLSQKKDDINNNVNTLYCDSFNSAYKVDKKSICLL